VGKVKKKVGTLDVYLTGNDQLLSRPQ